MGRSHHSFFFFFFFQIDRSQFGTMDRTCLLGEASQGTSMRRSRKRGLGSFHANGTEVNPRSGRIHLAQPAASREHLIKTTPYLQTCRKAYEAVVEKEPGRSQEARFSPLSETASSPHALRQVAPSSVSVSPLK